MMVIIHFRFITSVKVFLSLKTRPICLGLEAVFRDELDSGIILQGTMLELLSLLKSGYTAALIVLSICPISVIWS